MIEVIVIPVTEFGQNCRVLVSKETSDAIVVDPGGDAAKILNILKERDVQPSAIWLTHSHMDHCGGVNELKKALSLPLYAHPSEQEMRSHVVEFCAMFGLPPDGMDNCPEPETQLLGGETLKLGEESFEVIFTPGHSPGHLCFYSEGAAILLAGDVLFAGSIGRTDLPGGSWEVLRDSLRGLISRLPAETKVLSGHGPETTLGVEIKTNPFLQR